MFIGVSGPGVVTPRDIKRMAKDAIVFALANPTPEIMPEQVERYARIVATGRSDYANQINNVLAFPGIFRGALDARARDINEAMKVAAAKAIAATHHRRRIERGVHRARHLQQAGDHARRSRGRGGRARQRGGPEEAIASSQGGYEKSRNPACPGGRLRRDRGRLFDGDNTGNVSAAPVAGPSFRGACPRDGAHRRRLARARQRGTQSI